MKSGFALLKKKVCNNKVSEAFFNQVSNLDHHDPERNFDRVLSQRIAVYSPKAADIFGGGEDEQDSRWYILNQLIDTIPSFLFRLVYDWNQVAGDPQSSRNLLLGILGSLIWKDPDSQSHIDAFIADIDVQADIKRLNAQLIQKAEGDASVPKKVFTDFLAMTKASVPLVANDSLSEQIENLFYFESLFQFLLTYYFDLLGHAETETVTGYVHIIFLRLFSAVKKQELHYWDQFPEKVALRQALLDAVEEDLPEKCHPLLRKTVFKSIDLYNPLFCPSIDSSSSVFTARFAHRWDAFLSLSVMGTTLLLDTLMLLKGQDPVLSLLNRFYVDNYSKFNQLLDFLSTEKQKAHPVLFELVQQVAGQKPTQNDVIPISAPPSQRTGRMLTQDQISEYLKERLLNLYDRVKLKGALTQDQISAYLASISGDIAGHLSNGVVDHHGIDTFVEEVEPEIKEMSALGMLAREEKEAFQQQLCHRADKVAETYRSDDADDQEALVEDEVSTETVEIPGNEEDTFLQQEIIPIGFEQGAPKIPIGAFFQFPFTGMDGKGTDPFSQHLRYLEEAVRQSMLDEDRLSEIRSRLSDLPRLIYRKTYDIFPLNRFDETELLIVFSLWRNGALGNLLVEADN